MAGATDAHAPTRSLRRAHNKRNTARVARLAPASRARLSTRHTPQPLSQHVKNASKGPCAVAARAHPSARARPAAESACCVSTRHSREERPAAMSCERRTTAAAHASRNILHTRTYKARPTRAHTSWNSPRGSAYSAREHHLRRKVMRPLVRSYGESSHVTESPTRILMKFFRILPETCARMT